jgi:hypothetical protein
MAWDEAGRNWHSPWPNKKWRNEAKARELQENHKRKKAGFVCEGRGDSEGWDGTDQPRAWAAR